MPLPTTPLPAGSPREVTLVTRAADGDHEAFHELYARYCQSVTRYAYMIVGDHGLAEDIMQETFVHCWTKLHTLNCPEAFQSWLYRSTSRRATSVVRKQARRATHALPPEDLHQAASQGAGGDQAHTATGKLLMGRDAATTAISRVALDHFHDTLANMDNDIREVWVLREVDGLSYEEIAQALRITASTVRGRLHRARTIITREIKPWT